MPDASIVVKATDRYSEAMKKMASVTKSFSKDVDALEDTLYALNKNKITLKMDLSKAKSELKAAEKQFDLTHSAADGLKLELAQANYDSMVRNLKAVTSAARDTEKAISKVENQSKSQKATVTSVATAIAASGIGDMAKELALSFGTSVAGSLGGGWRLLSFPLRLPEPLWARSYPGSVLRWARRSAPRSADSAEACRSTRRRTTPSSPM